MNYRILLPIALTIITLSCTQESAQEDVQKQHAENYKYKGPIIDMHMHTGLPHEVPAGTPALCRPEPCEGDGQATVEADELMKKTLEQMDRHNIRKAFLSGADWNTVLKWKKAAPERIIASTFIMYPQNSKLKELREAYASGQFEGMGEIATQLNGIPPNDPSLDPYFQMAEELNLPVLIHTLGIGPYMPQFRSASGRPLLLEEVLVKHPKLRLYVENAGYPYRDEMIAMMSQYPQLYADVSTITWVIPRSAFYDYLETLIKAGLGKRLMFGSDQMVWPEKISAAVEAIEQAPFLTEEQKQDIFYHNAVRFLQLEESENTSSEK